MTAPDEIRSEWKALRDRLDREARGMKMSQAASVELSLRFGSLDPDARAVVEGVLADWIESDDESLRFDAVAIVTDHDVTSTLPALRRLATRLRNSDAPGAPYEREKVLRVIDRLETPPVQSAGEH